MIPTPFFCDICGAANQPQALFCRTCGSPLQSTSAPSRNTATGRLLPNYLLKQRYRILDSVGKGGMAAVYRAEDTQLGNRKVAIKEMSQSGLNPQEVIEAADAFKQEAYILAGLQHPNLPSIYDHLSEAGRWYLVMSFIEGETLEEYLNQAKGGRLPVEEVLQIGTQLCRVLDYLHTRQPPIIFRDLKPSNIMRTTDGHIYLIDFGIARHFKPGQVKDTAAYGSMGYASPEHYGKAQTTPRSDIYSLGAVLYQLLSGYDPSDSPFRFPSLQSQVPTIPAEFATLITRMLELDENERPPSALVVGQKLQSLSTSPGGTLLTPPTVLAGTPPLLPTVKVGTPLSQSLQQTIAIKPPYTPGVSAPRAQITVLRVFRAIFYFVIAVPLTMLAIWGIFNVATGKNPLGRGIGSLLSIGLLAGSIVLFLRLRHRVQRLTWIRLMVWIVGATVGEILLGGLLTALVPDTKGIVWSLFTGILLLLYGLTLAGGMLW